MTPAAAARSLLIADKVMSNNFVSRNVLNVWRTNKVSPTLMTLHRWAGLFYDSCLVFLFFWYPWRGIRKTSMTAPRLKRRDGPHSSRNRERNVTIVGVVPAILVVMLIFLVRQMTDISFLQRYEDCIGLCLSAF